MSRVLVAAFLVVLAFAGTAQATSAPPYAGLGKLQPLTIVQLPHSGRTTLTCSLRGRGLHGKAGAIEKKLAPVACEQPPRSQVLDGNFVLGP